MRKSQIGQLRMKAELTEKAANALIESLSTAALVDAWNTLGAKDNYYENTVARKWIIDELEKWYPSQVKQWRDDNAASFKLGHYLSDYI